MLRERRAYLGRRARVAQEQCMYFGGRVIVAVYLERPKNLRRVGVSKVMNVSRDRKRGPKVI